MTSPVERMAQRVVASVESVAPDEIRAVLDTDAPRSTAIVEGIVSPFPSINSYVLVPTACGAMVGIITWLGVERSPFPKRSGFKDFGLIDLPYPHRKMWICPVGMLTTAGDSWRLDRGVRTFPSVGDSVVLPTRDQTIAIVRGAGEDGRIPLGTCPSAYDAQVTADPNKMFGRHLAVLGNTGSGKSCTVAGLIRACVTSAEESLETDIKTPNARFIVLDPNGEYSTCFSGLGKGCRVFKVPPLGSEEQPFLLPAWMWNSSEWSSVAQAAPRTQRPLLTDALRNLKTRGTTEAGPACSVLPRTRQARQVLLPYRQTGTGSPADHNGIGNYLGPLAVDFAVYESQVEDVDLRATIRTLRERVEGIEAEKKWATGRYNAFGATEIRDLLSLMDAVLAHIPESEIVAGAEDAPIPFAVDSLAEHLEAIAALQGGNVQQFISFLTMRIRMVLADTRMRSVVVPDEPPTLAKWLAAHIGENQAENGQLAVIDLSLVPYEILHLVISVTARLVLESLQRYRRLEGINLPTVLVLEEAHTFISRKLLGGDDIPTPADMCRTTFERIAREGRKFGLGLVLSSQRPSELSETVLAQCNSFLLHRITNEKDQDLVSRLVPDNARGLLRELPSLPTRQAIFLGLATKIPIIVDVPELRSEDRPKSDDPKFWEVWTGIEKRTIDWEKVVKDWIGKIVSCEGEETSE